MPNVTFIPQFSAGAIGIWSLVLLWLIALVKAWPAIKAKVNEARKIELDADAELRGDLLRRIGDLEQTQTDDRNAFSEAMSNERRRCDEELDSLRARMRTAEDELRASEEERKGLRAMIRQASESTAFALGQPGEIAASTAMKSIREKKK